MKYEMKDLGYPRTPTDAMIRIYMEFETWDVPVQIVADMRDQSKHERDGLHHDVVRDCKAEGDSYPLIDWAFGNMDWSDVEQYAVQVPMKPTLPDRQDGWVNGKRTIIGNL